MLTLLSMARRSAHQPLAIGPVSVVAWPGRTAGIWFRYAHMASLTEGNDCLPCSTAIRLFTFVFFNSCFVEFHFISVPSVVFFSFHLLLSIDVAIFAVLTSYLLPVVCTLVSIVAFNLLSAI